MSNNIGDVSKESDGRPLEDEVSLNASRGEEKAQIDDHGKKSEREVQHEERVKTKDDGVKEVKKTDISERLYQYKLLNKTFSLVFNISWNIVWLILLSVVMVAYTLTFHNAEVIQATLTAWSYYLTMLYLLSSLLYALATPPPNSARYHIQRLLHAASATNEFIVMVGYWPWAFTGDIPTFEEKCEYVWVCFVFTITSHLLVVVPPWAALAFQVTDVRWIDIILVVVFNAVYSVVLVVYTLFRGEVYSVYTYKKVFDYLVMALMWIFAILVFVGVLHISRCLKKKAEEKPAKTENQEKKRDNDKKQSI